MILSINDATLTNRPADTNRIRTILMLAVHSRRRVAECESVQDLDVPRSLLYSSKHSTRHGKSVQYAYSEPAIPRRRIFLYCKSLEDKVLKKIFRSTQAEKGPSVTFQYACNK